MLVGKYNTVRRRVFNVLALLAGTFAAVVALAFAGGEAGLWDWPPRASSRFGVGLGVVGGAIILFEMALTPRKVFRRFRLGATKVWLRWHVYLGLVCLPVIVLHSGFAFGGPLPAVTFALFLAVIASGVWGLVLQQWLPTKMLADVPGETVASEVDKASRLHRDEARRLVAELTPTAADPADGHGHGHGHGGAAVAAPRVAAPVAEFHATLIEPYLRSGRRSGSPLASEAEARRRFTTLRAAMRAPNDPAVNRLEELCDLRRRWDRQRRLQFWLHSWLLVHLPLSVLMTLLMVVHAARALKYW